MNKNERPVKPHTLDKRAAAAVRSAVSRPRHTNGQFLSRKGPMVPSLTAGLPKPKR
jgi:hypothetical protein